VDAHLFGGSQVVAGDHRPQRCFRAPSRPGSSFLENAELHPSIVADAANERHRINDDCAVATLVNQRVKDEVRLKRSLCVARVHQLRTPSDNAATP
jgi:hypothetical protein